jgi:SAM-dependent methyltransferase
LLSTELLDDQRALVNALRSLARTLDLEFGWHYLLDLTWIINRLTSALGDVHGKRILEGGAGTGMLQWYLAEHGAQVISVDRSSRAALPLRFRLRYQVRGLRPHDLLDSGAVFRSTLKTHPAKAADRLARDLLSAIQPLRSAVSPSAGAAAGPPTARSQQKSPSGSVTIYNQDLASLVDIPDASLDAVVAVSALEHNTPEGLQQVISELLRVMKPGAPLLATLTANPPPGVLPQGLPAQGVPADEYSQQAYPPTGFPGDTWHTPSSGWLYGEASLRRLFRLPADAPANYDRYAEIFARVRDCAELRNGLARFYFRSGDNGMPWGKWDPQYIPVGVCQVKNKSSE